MGGDGNVEAELMYEGEKNGVETLIEAPAWPSKSRATETSRALSLYIELENAVTLVSISELCAYIIILCADVCPY